MEVCVLGRIGYDLHAVEQNQPLADVKHFSRHLGGSSANIALQAARAAGLRTAFDMDYRASSWQSPAEAGAEARKALPWVDVLLGNEDELSLLSGKSEARAQAQIGLDAGVSIVIRKRGADGVEAYSRDQCVFAPKCAVKVVSTIGAGDGFAAGLLYGLVRGLSLDECLRYGNAVAAIVVSRISCSDAMPYLKELNEFLALVPRAGTLE